MKRPQFNEQMYIRLAEKAGKIFNTEDDFDLDTIKNILKTTSDDGFQLGKEFEENGFHVDAQTISDLECLKLVREDILREFIKNRVTYIPDKAN